MEEFVKYYLPGLIIVMISAVIAVGVVWLSYRLNGGRGLLFKSTQDHGPDHYITLSLLNGIASDIVESHGYDSIDLSISHEVGNRYSGYFYDRFGHMHAIEIRTDGWNISYKIDDGCFRRYKS